MPLPGNSAPYVSDKDNGYNALMQRFKELETASWQISIGVHESEGKIKHDGTVDADLTVVDVATFHEFGLGNNPRRSFIGDYFDQNEDQIKKWSSKAVQDFIAGKKTREQALNYVGSMIVGGIQARIAAGINPPLSNETIQRKGSSVPLIDTGQLRTSITYRIV